MGGIPWEEAGVAGKGMGGRELAGRWKVEVEEMRAALGCWEVEEAAKGEGEESEEECCLWLRDDWRRSEGREG